MAKAHVLEGSGASPGTFRVIAHVDTPISPVNNSAGIAWPTAIINSGRNVTRMTVGNGAGQITAAERDQIVAGTRIEGELLINDDTNFTGPQRAAYIDTLVDRFIAEMLANLAIELKYFGATRP